jgi:lysophospholipase L1-like esterase
VITKESDPSRAANDPARALAKRTQLFTAVVAFGSGALCMALMFVAVGVVLRLRPGIASRAQSILGAGPSVLEVPPDVLMELREQRAVVDNAEDLTPQREHDTILTQPDADLEYVLRPLVHLNGNVLAATGEMNLDPPVLYQLSSASLSASAQHWIRAHSRMELAYSTDQRGRRLTFPVVQSDHKILIVGDSVAFGVGVNDEDTVASQLQQTLGTTASVINAGVGGHNGDQAFQMAEKLSRTERFETLVYIACQNDFETVGEVRPLLERFRTIANRFSGNVIVILETYLEYNGRDVLLAQGWHPSDIAQTDQLRAAFPHETKALGFLYADWSDIVDEYRPSVRSVFSPFALYVDHCHLSRIGTSLMAKRIHALLRG